MFKSLKVFLIFGLCLVSATGVDAQEMVQIKGSDTLINLVQKLSEEYMARNKGKYIAITGGGSGTGIAALINGTCDIANASRDIKDKEIAAASKRGVKVNEIVLAVDGLSIITSAKNPVNRLTVDEIGKIFRGEIKNWKEVGGADMSITLYGRQSNSGTYAFMMEEILKGDYSLKMNQMNGNAQIFESVVRDASGIGYVGVGYVKAAKGINIVKIAKTKGGYYASPLSTKDIESGKYAVARNLYQYVNGTPKGAVKAFIEYELSAEGQKIVEEEGFFPIGESGARANAKVLN